MLVDAVEIAQLVSLSDETKLDIFTKYSLMADAIYGGTGTDLISSNIQTFRPLMSSKAIKWVITEKVGKSYMIAARRSSRLSKLLETEANAVKRLGELAREAGIEVSDKLDHNDILNGLKSFGLIVTDDIDTAELYDYASDGTDDLEVDFDNDFDVATGLFGKDAELVNVEQSEEEQQEEEQQEIDVSEYNERIHGGYRSQIEELLLTAWEDLYGYYADGKEIVDGFIVPGSCILGTGESIKYEGVLTLNTSKIKVKPNTMSNAIYEEFISAARHCGIDMIQEVSDNVKEVKPFKYNPMLQRKIASGSINKEAFKGGWKEYSKALKPFMDKKLKELAIIRADTGSDEEIYKALSGYITSLMVVNYKDGLGTQLRICCGDTSKTSAVARKLVYLLKVRDQSHKSIAQGKLIVGEPVVSSSGQSATISIYQNMAGYQAVPQFMGELLCNLSEGMFKPSLTNMIIGMDLKNNIVTAPFNKWLIPILAGSRSGKGVLTLNMLLNVFGGGTPLFYLDGKPDMAALIWKLQSKYNVPNSIVVDGIGFKGVTDVDRKRFRAPYADNLERALASQTADEILETNFGVMVYLKTMMVILLSCKYYKDEMASPYGDIFVVFDEMYKVIKTQVETLILNVDTAIAKLDKADKERKAELSNIKMWVQELLTTYIGNDIGVFGAGIKAVALSQFSQVTQYSVSGFPPAKTFCENFLLKRGVKIFGRQEGGSGTYGVARDKGDDMKFDLYDKYFHFGIGSEQGNTYNNIKTFKPLLVLNENDCMEMTGESKDGAFTADMLSRVALHSDVNAFRQRYFSDKSLSASIGFEGALSEVGRLLGVDWTDMLRKSLSRSYEIAEGALKYYGIIGVDNINSVYDYICSFEIGHLWSYNDIIRAKSKGISLGGESIEGNSGTYDESVFGGNTSDNSLFNSLDNADGTDDIVDFGVADMEENINAGGLNGETVFGGVHKELSAEEKLLMNDVISRRNLENTATENEEHENEEHENEEHENEEHENEERENEEHERKEKLEYDIANSSKPEEEFNQSNETVVGVGGKTDKNIKIKPTPTTPIMNITPDNSIEASLESNHPLEGFEKKLFKTLKGSNYEFNQRWIAILKSVEKRVEPSLITRVLIVEDEIYFNGRLVVTDNILGGFANIRLEDLVDYKELFKRFRNIKDISLDSTMVERFQMEQSNLPTGFFVYSDKLLRVNILMQNGTKEVINRGDKAVSDGAEEAFRMAENKSKFRAICASKNPRLEDKEPGYKNSVWKSTKTFTGKGWGAVTHQLTKENPSFMKATALSLVTIGVLAVGSTIHGIGSIFKIFKR